MNCIDDWGAFDLHVFESEDELGADELDDECWTFDESDKNLLHEENDEDYGFLYVSSEDLGELEERADYIDRSEERSEVSIGRKNCATRHGCTGATNCNYDYASYPD